MATTTDGRMAAPAAADSSSQPSRRRWLRFFRLTEHYVRYFEERILADPGSWGSLADRRWAAMLRRAAARTRPAGEGP